MKCIAVAVLFIGLFSFGACAKDDAYGELAQKDFDGAIALFQKTHEANSNLYEPVLMIARIYSWTRRFDESLFWYEKAIALKTDDVTAYVERARVFFWARRRAESVASYQKALQVKQEKWIQEEMEAVQSLIDGKVKSSLNHYDASIEANEKNQEALMMAGSLYSGYGLYSKAVPYFEKVLLLNPDHGTAKPELEKAKIRSSGYKITSGLWGWYGKSTERLTDVDVTSPYISLSKNISDEVTLQGEYAHGFYHYPEANLGDNSAALALNYQKQMDFGFGGQFSFRQHERGGKDRNSFFLNGWWNIFEGTLVNLFAVKENLINNYDTQKNDINSTFFSEKIEQKLWKNYFKIYESVKYGEMTDANRFSSVSAGIDLSMANLIQTPYIVVSKDWLKYKKASSYYFAPSKYSFYTASFGVRNTESEVFRYDVGVKITYDSNQETSWRPELSCSYDLSSRFILKGKTAMTRSKYYNDKSFEVGLTYYAK